MSEDGKRIGEAGGPYDLDELLTPESELANSHLDLGSVLMPVVEGGQVTVEMSPDHQPEAVYLVTPVGRIGIHAFAAPRSGGMWREVVRELADSLRADGASTSIVDGHWGREVIATVPGGEHRFIGVDGSRWMVRCIASGPEGVGEQLAQLARAVLAETVVRRGNEPYPPREVLPIVLPPVLAEQVAAAQQQLAEEGRMPASEPLSSAPTVTADESLADPVVPGGAVEQSATATVFTEPGAELITESDIEQAPEVETDADPVAVDDPTDPDPTDAGETGQARSQGSALSRLRRRRRN